MSDMTAPEVEGGCRDGSRDGLHEATDFTRIGADQRPTIDKLGNAHSEAKAK
ncbi:hypothetical protein [Trinickia fusca]|uniref:hypothetical protein n=1 Tax=Trinickia fusca TaxID=2419777 RepID=UPI001603194A|nr:hypothetical protein [Trinickia fusca]